MSSSFSFPGPRYDWRSPGGGSPYDVPGADRPDQYSSRGLSDTVSPQALSAVQQAVQDRNNRVADLLQYGEPYWLPVSLGIASPAPAAGTQNTVLTNNQDFDLLIVGAQCSLRLSTIEIVDSARNHSLTNGTAPIPSFAQVVQSSAGGVVGFPWDWVKPYLLPAKAQLRLVITADGTETGGTLTFRCLQPPTYQW